MNVIQCSFKRYEKKYLLTREEALAVRRGMAPFVKPDAYPRYSIGNIYYDTEDWSIIRASLEKPVYKEKLRLRSYGVPAGGDRAFAEIKKKYEDVVYKRRVTMEAGAAARWLGGKGPGDESQIGREIDWFLGFYKPAPKVYIAYDREAWAAKDGSELRVTFDTALRVRSNDLDLRSGDYGIPLLVEDLVLMEVKIPAAAPLWLARLLSENGIFPSPFSKYGEYYKRFVLGGSSAEARKEVLRSA